MSNDELEEVLYWLGREITETRRALWEGKSGKAFASIEAAEEEFEKLQEIMEDQPADTGTAAGDTDQNSGDFE